MDGYYLSGTANTATPKALFYVDLKIQMDTRIFMNALSVTYTQLDIFNSQLLNYIDMTHTNGTAVNSAVDIKYRH